MSTPTTRPDGAALSAASSVEVQSPSPHRALVRLAALGGVEHRLTGSGEECFYGVAELLVLPRPFDAIAVISHASCTHQVTPTPRHPIRPRTPRPAKVGRPTFPDRKPP
jgi:hypothetical protein